MKQSKDPFEAAFEEQEDSPPESPDEAFETQNPSAVGAQGTFVGQEDDISNTTCTKTAAQLTPATKLSSAGTSSGPMTNATKNKDDEEEEEEENMDVELGKYPTSGDPDKMVKMQAILSQFTEEQMSRYESFRRAGFQKANMKRLLASITGTQKISVPMTIAVSGIAKMFVGDVVETEFAGQEDKTLRVFVKDRSGHTMVQKVAARIDDSKSRGCLCGTFCR